jgi:hypothetical protein
LENNDYSSRNFPENKEIMLCKSDNSWLAKGSISFSKRRFFDFQTCDAVSAEKLFRRKPPKTGPLGAKWDENRFQMSGVTSGFLWRKCCSPSINPDFVPDFQEGAPGCKIGLAGTGSWQARREPLECRSRVGR